MYCIIYNCKQTWEGKFQRLFPFFHALTGYDTMSSFSSVGKKQHRIRNIYFSQQYSTLTVRREYESLACDSTV